MRTTSALVRIALALVVSVVAGVVLAAMAFPVVGALGLIGQSAAEEFTPEEPPPLTLSQRSRILDRNGAVIATLFSENRVPVRLRQVPVHVRNALIAIEDNRFYEHRGIDVKGTLRALARNSSAGTVEQGGSTLTQQYVKNRLIVSANSEAGQKAASERSVKRKLQEAKYALWIEQNMTKDEILEGYLNIAYYGSGVYGIGTAANRYFNVRPERLTIGQGALLAGMVQSPNFYDPVRNPRESRARRNVVLTRMADLGYLSPAQASAAIHEPLGLKVTTISSGCEAPEVTSPFFCDYVRRYLEDGPVKDVLGATRQERQERLLSGGLTIRTTLDPKVQASAQQAVNDKVPAGDPFGAVAVADVVEPSTGMVRAMAVNRKFGNKPGQTKVNFAIGGSLGFQGGSTFKAFVLARALQMGISPTLTLFSPQRYCPKAFPYKAGDGKCGPSNAGDSESGTFDMVKATWESVNTYFIQLEERTGLITPPSLAEALGVRQIDGTFKGDNLAKNPSFVLGTSQVSPLAMAGAYGAFANNGVFCPPRPVTEVLDSRGRPLDLKLEPCSQVLEPEVADMVTAILRGVIDGPVGGRTGAGASIGRPAAGKTGTTNDSTAAWFVGYTPQLSTAVWVGKPTPTPMRQVLINGRFYKQVYGGTIPASIFQQLMIGALDGVPVVDFDKVALDGTSATVTVPVPDVRGLPVDVASAQLIEAGFGVTVGAAVNAGPVPAGGVAYTTPRAGAPVPTGAQITIIPSNGLVPVASPTATKSAKPIVRPTKEPPPSPTPTASPAASPQPNPTRKPR